MDGKKLNIMYSITPQASGDKKFSKVKVLLYYPIYLQYIQKILSTISTISTISLYPHATFKNLHLGFYFLLRYIKIPKDTPIFLRVGCGYWG